MYYQVLHARMLIYLATDIHIDIINYTFIKRNTNMLERLNERIIQSYTHLLSPTKTQSYTDNLTHMKKNTPKHSTTYVYTNID